jgi:hypothetical protein
LHPLLPPHPWTHVCDVCPHPLPQLAAAVMHEEGSHDPDASIAPPTSGRAPVSTPPPSEALESAPASVALN